MSGVAAGRLPSLFVSENGLRHTDLYDARGEKIGAIAAPTGGLATDRQGNLYVANYHEGHAFRIFAPPYNGDPTIISFYEQGYIDAVAVDQKTGVFAILSTSNGGDFPDAVSFFAHGTTTPCAVVTNLSGLGGLGPIAVFDASGTLFFDDIASPETDGVASISGECNATKSVRYSPAIHFIDSLNFDANDDLVIGQTDGLYGGPLETFAHPKDGVLGKLLRTTNLNPMHGHIPTALTFSSDGKGVWASVFGDSISLYRYPEGGAPIETISNVRNAATAAVFPELVP